jgi:hypothetical protein
MTKITGIVLTGTLCLTVALTAHLALKTRPNEGLGPNTAPKIIVATTPDTVTEATSEESVISHQVLVLPARREPRSGMDVSTAAPHQVEVQQRIAASDQHPSEVVQDLISHASDSLHTALEDPKRFPELIACRQTGADCRELQSRALAAALAWPLRDELFHDTYGLGEMEKTYGAEAVQDLLHKQIEAYARSADVAERIMALALLESRQFTHARSLSPTVFDDLASRPAPEITLLLEQYERLPLMMRASFTTSGPWQLRTP